jgi:hypothetical protein
MVRRDSLEELMIDRRRFVCCALTGAAALILLPSSTAQAQQAFQRYIPFLVELEGWKAGKPDGVSLGVTGVSMITATREYRRGEAKLNAHLISGAAAQIALATIQSGMKLETSETRMSTSTIDGFPVNQSFNIPDKSGGVVVALGPSAVFTLSFEGLADDEALAVARRFNWKAMQAAVPK